LKISWGAIFWSRDLDAATSVSAWVALTDSGPENGGMWIIPGSHRLGRKPHAFTFAKDNLLSRGQEIQLAIDESIARHIILRAGEMSLHHSKSIHSSSPNTSDATRIGFIVRFVTPQVTRIPTVVIRARGSFDCRHLEMLEQIPGDDFQESIAAWNRHVQEDTSPNTV
jgi:non-heme Fe2+,alpha-ketoglutarate-dependent halogenase